MRRLLPTLLPCLLLACGLQAEFKYLRDAFPPDHDTLESYRTGKVAELQETLAEAWFELSKAWTAPEQDRERADALRRALLALPSYEAALEAQAALPALPEKRKDYKSRMLDDSYLEQAQALCRKHGGAFVELARKFAEQGLPLAASWAWLQARHGAEGDKRMQKQLDEAEAEFLAALGRNPLRVVSYNLLYPGGTDINDKDPEHWLWGKRRPLHDENLRMMQADVVGLQEISSWPELLQESWGDIYGLYRLTDFTGDPKQRDTDVAILYNKLRYEIVEQGYRHLNRYNDIKNKKADWGAQNSRQVSWLRLRDRASGLQFYFHDTHTAWAGESYKGDDGETGNTDDLHERQMTPCMEEVEKACPLLPQIFVGDFNNRGGAPWRMLVEEGPFDEAHSHRDLAFGIDWIVGTPHLKLKWAGTVYATEGEVRASDHLQVIAYYELPELESFREAHEAEPDDTDKALAYIRALLVTDPVTAAERLDKIADAQAKGERDESLWLLGQLQEYFAEPEDAIKTYRKLEKESDNEVMRHTATWRAFAVLVWRKLAKPRDVKLLRKYAEDKDTPPEWAERARKLLDQVEAS